ncbi:hypothetical protein ACE193_01435 [Bernardetia sp. OM2101]|uniref:hypothetical protein n=1 Tax=Bernardetia sp. OM2101 TaxID=3344876 RepID=UPI0035CFBAAD
MKFSSKAKSSLTEKREKEVEELNITEEITLSFSMTPQIERDLAKARMLMQKNKKEGVKEIKNYIQRHSHVNTFYNYLTNLYRLQGKSDKELEVIKVTLKKFPSYSFAKISLINYYIDKENIEELDAIFGDTDTIQDFFPKKTLFHDSEITAFYAGYLNYLALKEEDKKIKEVWNLLEVLATEYDSIKQKLSAIKSQYSRILIKTRMAGLGKSIGSIISIKPTNTSSVKENEESEKPTFNHEETNQLYEAYNQNLTKEKVDMFLGLPKETFIQDLEMILEDIQMRKKSFYEAEQTNYNLPYYALTFLSTLEAKDSVNKMLNIFRQDKSFLEFWFDFYLEPSYIALIFYKFFKDDFEGIFDFIKEENNEYSGRVGLISIPAQVALNEPNRRKEVLDFYETLADFFIENKQKKAILDHHTIEYLTFSIQAIQGKELREKVLDLDKAGLVNNFLNSTENILQELEEPFYSTLQSKKIDVTMSVYEMIDRLKEQKEFFLPNTEEEEEKLKEHHKKMMEDSLGNDSFEEVKDLFSGLLNKEELEEPSEKQEIPSNFYQKDDIDYKRNDKVTVRYKNGKIIENTKYKKVEKDVKEGKCIIV